MKQSHKTLLLWILLVGTFITIYSMVEPDEDGSRGSFGMWFAAVMAAVALLVVIVGLGQRRGRAENERGLALLARGRHADALAEFTAARARNDDEVYRLNAANARLMLFRVTDALRDLEVLERSRRANLAPIAKELATLGRALSGRDTDADRKLAAASEHPYYFLIRAIHAMRRRAFTEADALLSSGEIRQLGGKHRALADTLSAWCALELRGERVPVDRAALFGEAAPDGLYEVWPDLEAFLERDR